MARNYKNEYEKFQDSPSQLKKRAALNRANYKKGTYGNNDGLDVSHTEDGIRLEKSSINKGRKEKSRMKGSKRNYKNGGTTTKPTEELGMIHKLENRKKENLERLKQAGTPEWHRKVIKENKEIDRIIHKGMKHRMSKVKASKKQQGGYLQGKSHKNGGIAAVIGGQEPVELEGGEYIIKKSSVDKLGKDVLAKINKEGRIPAMANGGKVKKSKKTPISFEEYTKEMEEVNKKFKLDGKIPYELTKQEHAERDSLRDSVIQKYDPSYKTKYTKANGGKVDKNKKVKDNYGYYQMKL